MKKLTTEEFILKAKLVHGDKYDYSKVNYNGNKIKTCFICPEHGEFWQRPNDLLSGMGCPKCGTTNKLNTNEFISKAKIIHNNFFSYEKTVYINSNEKVIVTCPIHGDFEVKANNHLNGVNCEKCKKEGITHETTKLTPKNKSTKTYNTETFIEKCKQIHGDKYDYSKVDYVNNRTKICIICPKHGEFYITPNHFLSGRGCSKCSGNYRYTTSEIIEKFKEIHGDKYDYSKVEYKTTHTNIIVICPKHGEFLIVPSNHLRGQGCPLCNRKEKKIQIKESVDKNLIFIEKAKKVHGDKYDYSKVEYVNSNIKVCIVCMEHGEFWQTPYSHLSGCGCPVCGKKKSDKIKTLSLNEFIEKAKKIHGDKYDYSKVEYVNNSTKVCIICPKHGEFWQTPSSHLSGSGCKNCFEEKKKTLHNLTKEQFIEKAKKVHGDKYDYSKVDYVNARTKVCIICPEHGEFWQDPYTHSIGGMCQKCRIQVIKEKKTLTKDEFIERAKKIHGEKYNYSISEYKSARRQIAIKCPKHGEFWQIADAHMRGSGCPICANSLSTPENEIYNFINNNIKYNVEQRNRSLIKPYELDIHIPELKIAIEYNGLYWHSTKFIDNKNKHLEKMLLCKKNDIKLITIFEDEFYNSKEIVLNKIAHILGIQQNLSKIYGRKCTIKQINKNDAEIFLSKFHIQGYASSTIYYGAFHENELIAVMSFKQLVKNGSDWELTRFASDYNYICCGVGGKLFKHFIKEHNPNSVKSFADRRWTIDEENNIYAKLGFKFDGYTPPDYKYIKPNIHERFHKFNFRKSKLLKKYPDILTNDMTENEMTINIGYFKIYDCGLIRYVWKNN